MEYSIKTTLENEVMEEAAVESTQNADEETAARKEAWDNISNFSNFCIQNMADAMLFQHICLGNPLALQEIDTFHEAIIEWLNIHRSELPYIVTRLPYWYTEIHQIFLLSMRNGTGEC
jgi:hypothetical protein